MLRITDQLELRFRKRESPLSFDFWKGLGIATSLHMLLFLFIRISQPPNLENIKPLMPVCVEVDLKRTEIFAPLPPYIQHSPLEAIDPPHLLALPQPTFVVEPLPLQEPIYQEAAFFELQIMDYYLHDPFEEEEDDHP